MGTGISKSTQPQRVLASKSKTLWRIIQRLGISVWSTSTGHTYQKWLVVVWLPTFIRCATAVVGPCGVCGCDRKRSCVQRTQRSLGNISHPGHRLWRVHRCCCAKAHIISWWWCCSRCRQSQAQQQFRLHRSINCWLIHICGVALEQPRSGSAPKKPLAVNADFTKLRSSLRCGFLMASNCVANCALLCVLSVSPLYASCSATQYTLNCDLWL